MFYDVDAILFDDPDHSIEEERFIILGLTFNDNICIVSHCYSEVNDTIRLISARKATKAETDYYYKESGGMR